MILRKRLLNRLHYGKQLWRYRRVYRYEMLLDFWKSIHRMHGKPEYPEILFGYWFEGSETTGNDMDDWGFHVYQDGRIVYTDGCICEKRREWEFQLPKACLEGLRSMLASHDGEYQARCVGTNRCGMLQGWQDIFYLSGFYFSAWRIRHHPIGELHRQHPSKSYMEACIQENWLLDIFDAGRNILQAYGFAAPFGDFSMHYVTGVHALNLPCSLETSGDWHASWIQWEHPHVMDTGTAFFGTVGIEAHPLPDHDGIYPVANHVRACLDMLEVGDFSNLQGMRDDYIGNDEYMNVIFHLTMRLHELPHWSSIDAFLEREYQLEWVRFRSLYPCLQAAERDDAPHYGMADLEAIREQVRHMDTLDVVRRAERKKDFSSILWLCTLIQERGKELDDRLLIRICDNFQYRPADTFVYFLEMQSDASLDKAKLVREFLSMMDFIGLRYSEDERELCESYFEDE